MITYFEKKIHENELIHPTDIDRFYYKQNRNAFCGKLKQEAVHRLIECNC